MAATTVEVFWVNCPLSIGDAIYRTLETGLPSLTPTNDKLKWHFHWTVAPDDLDRLMRGLPIKQMEDYGDTYYDTIQGHFKQLKYAWWLRGRTHPGAGTSWRLIECRLHNDCLVLDGTENIEKINEKINEKMDAPVKPELRELASFKATRYTLSLPAGTECEMYIDVVHQSDGRHFIVGTIGMEPDRKRPTFSRDLAEIRIYPVPSKVVQVLPVETREQVTKPTYNEQKPTLFDSDPLGYHKIRATDRAAELKVWFEKANRGRFREYYSKLVNEKTTGYTLSVLNEKKLPHDLSEDPREGRELLRAVRRATEFGHPELTRILRRPLNTLTRKDWLVINLLTKEALCEFGNVSVARAKKMSAEAKNMLFGA